MKKAFLSLTILCLIASVSFAQGKIKGEGMVKYKITNVESDDPMAAMMNGSTMDMYIGKDGSRIKMNMMAGMMQMDIIQNEKESVSLISMMGKKIKSVDKKKDEEETEDTDVTVKADKKDTKVICGYKCHKVTVTTKGSEDETVVYVTDKISLDGGKQSIASRLGGSKLGGYPLEMSVGSSDAKMTFTAQEVSKDLPKDILEYDDTGYEEMTPEQLEKMMGGGIGF